MNRWRCARWCCEAFVSPTAHQPYHLCDKTGTVDAYVADQTTPAALAAVTELVERRHLKAVA